MVKRHIVSRGVTDELVVQAMRTVQRERFIADDLVEFAYDDRPLPIEDNQTISQPFIVALMAEAAELKPSDRVLEVGTGSGYGAAVLGCIAGEVWTVERHGTLADQARRRLEDLGFDNVHVVTGDGTLGWLGRAPYDAIVVTADAPTVPPALIEQLADQGRLIIPVGPDRGEQRLVRVRRLGDEIVEENLGLVQFVPLIGEQGWNPTSDR
jgi:protein-L-isoaspartate(D-aspartate) O-methyltransferase